MTQRDNNDVVFLAYDPFLFPSSIDNDNRNIPITTFAQHYPFELQARCVCVC